MTEFVDTLGRLQDWLNELLLQHPRLRECCVFALDGDCLSTEHFRWCDEHGTEVAMELATEVTLHTHEMPYDPPPDIIEAEERDENSKRALRELLLRIDEIANIGKALEDAASAKISFTREERT